VGASQQPVVRAYRSAHREAQARRTRQRVLRAAAAVFLGRGYAGATMRAIATEAAVSVPTVESLFGTKARVLKAAIDVAIAGDDEQVPVLDRSWADAALGAETVEELLWIAAGVLGSAQVRSAGLVLALLEASPGDAELAELSGQMLAQRATTAAWLVDALARKAPLRAGCTREEAIDTVWVLMDPAVFDRLTRQRHWTLERYQRWFAGSVRRLLIADSPPPPTISARSST
jgi:AcrR family transcriptional regulator